MESFRILSDENANCIHKRDRLNEMNIEKATSSLSTKKTRKALGDLSSSSINSRLINSSKSSSGAKPAMKAESVGFSLYVETGLEKSNTLQRDNMNVSNTQFSITDEMLCTRLADQSDPYSKYINDVKTIKCEILSSSGPSYTVDANDEELFQYANSLHDCSDIPPPFGLWTDPDI